MNSDKNEIIDFNSLYEIFNINKENDELIKENNELKNKLMNLFSLVNEFNNKIENLKKNFMENDKK